MLKALMTAALLAAVTTTAYAEPFRIVALGDAPYGQPEKVYAPFETLIDTINARAPALVIHVGDTKSGSTPCSNKMLDDQLGYLNRFTAPVLYTPGDNEWTDCHRKNAGGFDPIERLGYIRQNYFANPDRSFGVAKAAVTSQAAAGYPENVRMMMNEVMFVTTHVIGSNNNFEIRDIAAVQEFMARDANNLAWLTESFATASRIDAKALVLAVHADMFQDGFSPPWAPETWMGHSGLAKFGPALIKEAAAFAKPVLLIYGDSHIFRQMRPFPKGAPNVMALEVPGATDMHAVEVTIDPATSGVFAVALVRNPALAE